MQWLQYFFGVLALLVAIFLLLVTPLLVLAGFMRLISLWFKIRIDDQPDQANSNNDAT